MSLLIHKYTNAENPNLTHEVRLIFSEYPFKYKTETELAFMIKGIKYLGYKINKTQNSMRVHVQIEYREPRYVWTSWWKFEKSSVKWFTEECTLWIHEDYFIFTDYFYYACENEEDK